MILPAAIERDLRAIEAEYEARGGQQVGPPRLRDLRASIALELQRYRVVLLDYLTWGAMPGFDRDYFESTFRAVLDGEEAKL